MGLGNDNGASWFVVDGRGACSGCLQCVMVMVVVLVVSREAIWEWRG